MKSRKKILIGILAGLAVLVVLVISGVVNPLLERSLEQYLREKIEILQATPTYTFSFESMDLDVMGKEAHLYGFRMEPRQEFEEAVLKGEQAGIKSVKDLRINTVTIKGIGLMNFLWDKSIQIDAIRIDSVSLDLGISERSKKIEKIEKEQAGLSLDGIRLPGIKELSLGSFNLGYFTLHQIKQDTRDTLISFTSEGGRLEGLGMKKSAGADASVFEADLNDLMLFLNEEKLDLRENLYTMGFEQLKYSFSSQDLDIQDLSFRPREEREIFREKNRYSYEIYTAGLQQLSLVNFDLDGFLNNGTVSIEKMELDSLELEIFRDKTKPFDTSRKALLLNQKMVALDFPFYIGAVNVRNSYLEYKELSEAGKDPLVLDFSNLEMSLKNLTSITEGLPDSQPLELQMTARLDRAIPVDINIQLPYNSKTFSVRGHTEGTSDFVSLNKTVLPAIGIQFKKGRLDGLRFDIRGTPWSLRGNLTMLYHDLEVEMFKEDHQKKATLSWAANALLKKSNPKPNGHTVVGEIHTERIPHKGLGNYLWKGVQSGIINSLNPVGKRKVVKHN